MDTVHETGVADDKRFSLLLLEPGEVYFEEHDVLCWVQSNKPLVATSPSSPTETLSSSPFQSTTVEALLPNLSIQEKNKKSPPDESHKFVAPAKVKDKKDESVISSPAVLIGEGILKRIPSDLSYFPRLADHTSCLPAASKALKVDEEGITWKKGCQESPIKGKLKICSKSVVFEADTMTVPVLRIPLRSCESLLCLGSAQGTNTTTKQDASSCKIEILCSLSVEMLQDNILQPYKFSRPPSGFVQNYVFEVLPPAQPPQRRVTVPQCRNTSSTAPGGLLPYLSQLHRAASLPPSEHNTMVTAIARGIHSRVPSDLTLLREAGEEVLLAEGGQRITPLLQEPGRVLLTRAELCYQPYSDKRAVVLVPVSSIKEVLLRRYLLQPVAVEVFCEGPAPVQHLFLAFKTEAVRNALYSLLQQVTSPGSSEGHQSGVGGDSKALERLTFSWVVGAISNYDYLLALNSHGGRSRNDLTQYPVFPWVVRDYSSPTLDLQDPKTFRDLTRPIGALNGTRLRKLKARLQELGSDGRFLYGSHYSTPGFVLFYLVRASPRLALCLHNGRFDHPDRMFNSLQDTYRNVTHNPSDFKELTPEFYDTSETQPGAFLVCGDGVHYGTRCDGRPVGDVELPAWANNEADTVRQLRAALESDHVSGLLHRWIDLIFGYRQRGQEAVDADNLFHPMCYEGAVNLSAVLDLSEREALEVQIAEFGQVPQQVFGHPHPRRVRHLGLYDALYLSWGRGKERTSDGRDGEENAKVEGSKDTGEDINEEVGSGDENRDEGRRDIEELTSFCDKYSITTAVYDDEVGPDIKGQGETAGDKICDICSCKCSLDCRIAVNGKCCSKGTCESTLKKKLLSRCLRSYLCGTCRFSFLHSSRRWSEWRGSPCEMCSNTVQNTAAPARVYCSAEEACAAGECPCSCGSHYLFRACAALLLSSSLQTITLNVPRRRNSTMNSGNESVRISVEVSEEMEIKKLEGKSESSSPKKSQESPSADELPAKAVEGTVSRKSSAGSPLHGGVKDATSSSKIQELFSKLKTGTLKKPKKEQSEATDGADTHCTEEDRRDIGKGHPCLLPLVVGLLVGTGAHKRNGCVSLPVYSHDTNETDSNSSPPAPSSSGSCACSSCWDMLKHSRCPKHESCTSHAALLHACLASEREHVCTCSSRHLRGVFEVGRSTCHTRSLTKLCFTPHSLPTLSDGPIVKVLQWDHLKQIYTRRISDFPNSSCLFLPSLDTLLVGSHDTFLYRFPIPSTGAPPPATSSPIKSGLAFTREPPIHPEAVTCLAWADGNLFTGSSDGRVRVWRMSHRPSYAGFQSGRGYRASCDKMLNREVGVECSASCSCSGDLSLAVGKRSYECCCKLVNETHSGASDPSTQKQKTEVDRDDSSDHAEHLLVSNQSLLEIPHDAPVTCLSVGSVKSIASDPEESWLAVGLKDGSVVVWTLSDLSQPKHVLKQHSRAVTALCWWSGEEEPCIPTFSEDDDENTAQDYDLCSGNFGTDRSCYDENPNEEWVLVSEHIPKCASPIIYSGSVPPSFKSRGGPSNPNKLQSYSLYSNALSPPSPSHPSFATVPGSGKARCSTGTATPHYLLSAGADGVVAVVAGRSGVVVADWVVREGVSCATWDGRVAVVGGLSGDLIVRDMATGTNLTRLLAHPGGVSCLSVSECGAVLATGGEDRTTALWGQRPRPSTCCAAHLNTAAQE